METNLGYGIMNSCMNFHTIEWLLVVPKPRACYDFILIKDLLKVGLEKL